MGQTVVGSWSRQQLLEAGLRTAGATLVGASGLAFLYLWFLLLSSVAVTVGPASPMIEQLLGDVATLLGTGTAAVLYLWASGRGLEFLDLRVPTRREVGWGVAGLAVLIGTLYASAFLIDLLGIEQATHGIVRRARKDPSILLISVPASLLLIGPGEELLYRNVVQKSLYDVFSRRTTIVVATIIFAVVHFPAYFSPTIGQTLVSLGVVFTLALVLGVVFDRTENLVVVAVVHGTFNALQFADLYCELTASCPVGILP